VCDSKSFVCKISYLFASTFRIPYTSRDTDGDNSHGHLSHSHHFLKLISKRGLQKISRYLLLLTYILRLIFQFDHSCDDVAEGVSPTLPFNFIIYWNAAVNAMLLDHKNTGRDNIITRIK
jgi:hypothetical protein